MIYIVKEGHNVNVRDLIRFVTGLPHLETLKFASSSLSPTDIIQFLRVCEPFSNLKTIGQVIPEQNLQNKINEIQNIMDDSLKNNFKGPVL